MSERGTVHELRLVVTTAEYAQALSFYRDALGPRELETYTARSGHVTILDAGRATLEINDPPYAAYIDDVEVGQRVAGHAQLAAGTAAPLDRVAFGVPDTPATTEPLVAAGAQLVAAPTDTPWNSCNARLEAPAGCS